MVYAKMVKVRVVLFFSGIYFRGLMARGVMFYFSYFLFFIFFFFPADLYVIFYGVTHSPTSLLFFSASLSVWSKSAEVIISGKQQAAGPQYPHLTQPCSTLQHPPTRPPNSPLQAHRYSRSTVGVRRRWSPSG
jgi:hypothetical protein